MIKAPPAAVWPWLIQMGQDRAGFYTHNWVERLLQSGIRDMAQIRPEWQQIKVGDLDADEPRHRGQAHGVADC